MSGTIVRSHVPDADQPEMQYRLSKTTPLPAGRCVQRPASLPPPRNRLGHLSASIADRSSLRPILSTPHAAALAPNDSDLPIIFQDRCSDLSDIRTTLMAQCLGKFCQSNVLPLHLVCPAAPVSDEDLGCAFEKPFGELAGTGQHAHAVGQSDQRRGRD
jgi:hypothetical protein